MVRISGFRCQGPGSAPGWGTEIMQAVQLSQKKEKKVQLICVDFVSCNFAELLALIICILKIFLSSGKEENFTFNFYDLMFLTSETFAHQFLLMV